MWTQSRRAEKTVDDFLLNVKLSLSGAEVRKSCRSRQMLSNEYLLLEFTSKSRLRYSRERTSQSLRVIQFIFFIRLLARESRRVR